MVHSSSEVAGTATDFEDGHPLGNGGLVYEVVVDLGHAQRSGQQIVERKQCVAAGRGQVVMAVCAMWPHRIGMIFGHVPMVNR